MKVLGDFAVGLAFDEDGELRRVTVDVLGWGKDGVGLNAQRCRSR